ncbi:MAG: hypothetical protein ABJA57_13090 [Ginsengibacter sp.]
MKRYSGFIVLVSSLLFLSSTHKQKNVLSPYFEDRWTGELTLDETIIYANALYNGKVVKHIHVSFSDVLPTMYREEENSNLDPTDLNFTNNKGTGNYTFNGETTRIDGQKCTLDCSGAGVAELHAVVINEDANTYDIEAIAPACKGTKSCTGEEDKEYEDQDNEIIVSNKHMVGSDMISGTETTSSDLPGGLGTATKTIRWHLIRSTTPDVELIVTPKDYDNWLPEPGMNEMMKGKVMTIDLKLQGKNGKPLKVKAESFELHLSNTSIEPGITINYPITPDPKQLPDLRFILLPNIESIDEDQFVSTGSPDGTTGKAFIASYDGGGWATLNVEAILKDKNKTHIKGHLLVSGGDVDILIPKRTPGLKIALAWAKTNGNPQDLDDKETSVGNKNNGDGLTAYEEYRGVISEGKYKRLDPNKKEVGIDIIKDDLSFFSEGIKWFGNATGLAPIIFFEDIDEIDLDRRINKNALTNHDYNQYALRLYKSIIPGRDKKYKIDLNETGSAGKAYGGPGIPAKVNAVVINYVALVDALKDWTGFAKRINVPMPFTIEQFVARITAHELGHGVNCWHHGLSKEVPDYTSPVNDPNLVRIYSYDFTPIYDRPYSINGPEKKGNQESGDIFCIMAYYPYCKWAYSENYDNKDYYMVPIIPISIGKMCNSIDGKAFNKKDAAGNNHYFGDANKGNCLSQIKLRD